MSVKKEKNNDEVYCNLIAKSISDIIRFSLDEEFRKSSFKLFDVSSTKEIEEVLSKKLLSVIQNKSTVHRSGKKILRKRCKNVLDEKVLGIESQREFEETLIGKETNQSSSATTDKDLQMPSQNFFEKNWLQISSQQYRNAIKKRKSNYFSQPQMSEVNQKHFQFFNYNSKVSNSQPIISRAPCSTFHETMNFSSELSDDRLNYCQKMFKENAKKYFKKNLISNKHISFY